MVDESSQPAALQIRAVRVTYPARRRQAPRTALAGIDLTIVRGQRVALLGPNGSGKSTLFRVICGLLTPDQGAIEVFGQTDIHRARAAMGVVFQSPGLDGDMTVRENLRDQLVLYGMPAHAAKARVLDALAKFGLTERANHLVRTLSGGSARRVDLCRALLHEPGLLLLDEPTAGLDPAAREQFLARLAEARAGGLSILMSTHLVDEADRMDRVVLLHEGQVVADDAPGALRNRLGAVRLTVQDERWQPDETAQSEWSRGPHGWSLAVGESNDRLRTIAADLAAGGVAFSLAPPTLADVFEAHTGVAFDRAPHPHEGDAR